MRDADTLRTIVKTLTSGDIDRKILDSRDLQASFLNLQTAALYEIAAQLSELNEKLAEQNKLLDYAKASVQ
jgi:hypothetical protein